MPDIEVTKAFIFDPLPIAYLIESRALQYLNTAKIHAENTAELKDSSSVIYSNAVIKKSEEVIDVFPITGLGVVRSYVNKILLINSGWLKTNGITLRDELRSYLLPEYQDNEYPADVLEGILFEIRNSIHEFIGEDKYIMHFMKTRKSDIVIEKTIDFRIYWYKQNVKE